METIRIERCPKPVSRLIKGTDYFTHYIFETAAENLDAYVAAGGNTIDTAFGYARGQSEEVIGRYLEERGNRDHFVILTKGAHPGWTPNGWVPRVNREAIRSDLLTSLERLRTDKVELYALHRDDPNVPVGEILEALNEHIEAGRIDAIGVSNWSVKRIREANEYAAKHGLIGFTFNSPNLSLAKANEEMFPGCVHADEEMVRWHGQSQMPLLSWSSQARGFFTDQFAPHLRDFDDARKEIVRVFYSEGNWERRRRAAELAKRKNATLIQIALAYVLNHPFPTCAVIGARNRDELKSCQEGAAIKLTPEEMDWLDLKS